MKKSANGDGTAVTSDVITYSTTVCATSTTTLGELGIDTSVIGNIIGNYPRSAVT